MTNAVRWVVVGVLSVHGLIHLMGAAKGLGWAEVGALRQPIGALAGGVWLASAALIVAAAAMIALRGPAWWWAVAAVAALVSQAMIVSSWSDAKAGTLPNVVLLLAAVYGFVSVGPPSYSAEWDQRARIAIESAPRHSGVVTEVELAGLPEPVARYVRRSGAVGQPHVTNFSARISGRIRGGPNDPWMSFTGRQLNTYGDTPQRLFYIDARRSGLPVTVFHVFDESGATMRGKVLSLVPILDAAGPEMNRSETVTLLNDLVVFAPGAIVDAPLRWTDVAGDRVGVTYTRAGQSVSAELVFDAAGDLVDFVSTDRFRSSSDGKSFSLQRWNTPITRYQEVEGRRIAVEGSAMWDAPSPDGHFDYIDFEVDTMAYNVDTPATAAATTTTLVPALNR